MTIEYQRNFLMCINVGNEKIIIISLVSMKTNELIKLLIEKRKIRVFNCPNILSRIKENLNMNRIFIVADQQDLESFIYLMYDSSFTK